MILGLTHRLVPVYYAMEGCGMYSQVSKKEYESMNEQIKKYVLIHYDIEEMDHREFFNTPD
jgi:hypothetical protein